MKIDITQEVQVIHEEALMESMMKEIKERHDKYGVPQELQDRLNSLLKRIEEDKTTI